MCPMLVNPSGKVTEVSPHPENAALSDAGQPFWKGHRRERVHPFPMLVNPSGKVTEVSPVHPENAPLSDAVQPLLERSPM